MAASTWLGERQAAERRPYRDYFIRYAYALLPIALFYHIAHNLEHLLMEGPKVVAMASDPFGWNWNLFGTARWAVPPLVSLEKLWLIQVFLVLVGHVYSLLVAQGTSLRLLATSRRQRVAASFPCLWASSASAYSVYGCSSNRWRCERQLCDPRQLAIPHTSRTEHIVGSPKAER